MAATLAAAVVVLLVRAGHGRQLTWGATPHEVTRTLPGDETGPAALVATRAITIDVPPATVWPWLVQLGQGRGGFYSYDVLENLVGLGIHSADHVVPQWQTLAPGDPVRLAEQVALTAVTVEPERAIVLVAELGGADGGPADGGADGGPADERADGARAAFVWAFVLEPHGGAGTRLIVRERYGTALGAARWLVPPLTWVSFVMTERMLRGIRDRAEGRRPWA